MQNYLIVFKYFLKMIESFAVDMDKKNVTLLQRMGTYLPKRHHVHYAQLSHTTMTQIIAKILQSRILWQVDEKHKMHGAQTLTLLVDLLSSLHRRSRTFAARGW